MSKIPAQDIPRTFQDVVCPNCSQHLTDARNAVVARDEKNGGLKGHHVKCPEALPEPKPATPVVFNSDHEKLLLNIAFTLRDALNGNVSTEQRAQALAAITILLKPFETVPGMALAPSNQEKP